MGASASCCYGDARVGPAVDDGRRRTSTDGSVLDDKHNNSSFYSQGSIRTLSALLPGCGSLDSSTLQRHLNNHFTLASTRESLEFVHGATRQSFPQVAGVDEDGFHFHSLIDTGGFGFVFKATRRTTGKTYALKVQPMEFMARLTRAGGRRKADEVSLQLEKTALALCRGHPFIVSLEYAFHTSLYAVLALEYVEGGTLSRLISHSPDRRLPCDLARTYTAEIAMALNFMHGKGLIFRDVKPSNILIALDGHIKLTDFGLAGSMLAKKKQVNPQECSAVDVDSSEEKEVTGLALDEEEGPSDSESSSNDSLSSEEPAWTDDEPTDDLQGDLRRVRRRTLCGTAGYRPPEQVGERYLDYQSRAGYDERVDFFSLGVTAYTMMCGQRPFPTRKAMLSEVNGYSSPTRTRRSSISDHQSSALQRAATRQLMKDIEFRCLMKEVKFPDCVEDEDAKSFIEQLLAKDPNNRPRFDGIRNHPWMSGVVFDAQKLKATKLPMDWVLKHAQQEANSRPRSVWRSSMMGQKVKTDLSLSVFIEDICCQMLDADNAAARWMAVPSAKTVALFRHWNYMSDSALELEKIAAKSKSRGFRKRPQMRRATA